MINIKKQKVSTWALNYSATIFVTWANLAVLILFAPACAAVIPVNVPVLTRPPAVIVIF